MIGRRLFATVALVAALLSPAVAQNPFPPGPPPPVPALPDSQRQTTYTITGTNCACAVGFQLYGTSTDFQNWIEVWLNGVQVQFNDPTFGWSVSSPTGPLSTITRPITDAVLTFNNVQTGTVVIVGAERPRRTAEFAEGQGVPARAINQSYNDLYAIDRETWDKINDLTGRGLFFAPGIATGPMPSPAACAGNVLGFSSGNGSQPVCFTMGPSGPLLNTVDGAGATSVTNGINGQCAYDNNGKVGFQPCAAVYVCTGTDLTALNALITSGIHALTISGACGVTTALTQLPANFTLRGSNALNDSISTSSATANVITVSTGDTVSDLGITSSVTRTAGDFIFASGVVNVTLDRLILQNIYNGIELQGVGSPAGICPINVSPCSGIHAQDIRIYGPFSATANDGILIDGSSGAAQPWNTDVFFSDIFITGADTSHYLQNGVEIKSGGDIHFTHLQVIYAGRAGCCGISGGLLIDPSGAVASGNIIQYFTCVGCLFDSIGAEGVILNPTSGAQIGTAKFADGWSASNKSYGIHLKTDSGLGSAINGIQIANETLSNNVGAGVFLDDNSNVLNLNVDGCNISGNVNAGNGDGIYVGVAASTFRIVNNKIGPADGFGGNDQGIHFAVTGSPAESIVVGNDISGNTTNVSGSPTITVKANNINF